MDFEQTLHYIDTDEMLLPMFDVDVRPPPIPLLPFPLTSTSFLRPTVNH